MGKINIDQSYGNVLNWAFQQRNQPIVIQAIHHHALDYYGGVTAGTLERSKEGMDHLRLDERIPKYGNILPLPDHIPHDAIDAALGCHCSAVISMNRRSAHISLCIGANPSSEELLIQDFITSNDIRTVEELQEIIGEKVCTCLETRYFA